MKIPRMAPHGPGVGGYGPAHLMGDLSGGLIAAMIALPYGLAMASLMGLPPVMGIFTSILSAPLIALLGSNPILIGGTSSVTVPFMAMAVQRHGMAGAAAMAILASLFMIVFSLLRLGRHITRVPHAVISGFSCGIGGLMIASQLNTLLGLGPASGAATPAQQVIAALWNIRDAQASPLLLGLVVIAAAAIASRVSLLLPAPLTGLVAAVIVASIAGMHEREVGAISVSFPAVALAGWSTWPAMADLIAPAAGLAFVASINILVTSRAVEHFRGRHAHAKSSDADAELRAYGTANALAGIFGVPPSVGIPARSLAVVKCGGTTQLANLIHAAALAAILCLGSSLVSRIPLPALAGTTVWMGIGLLNWSVWRRLPKMQWGDAGAFLITAIAVLFVNSVLAALLGCLFVIGHRIYTRAAFRRLLARKRRNQHDATASLEPEEMQKIGLDTME